RSVSSCRRPLEVNASRALRMPGRRRSLLQHLMRRMRCGGSSFIDDLHPSNISRMAPGICEVGQCVYRAVELPIRSLDMAVKSVRLLTIMSVLDGTGMGSPLPYDACPCRR